MRPVQILSFFLSPCCLLSELCVEPRWAPPAQRGSVWPPAGPQWRWYSDSSGTVWRKIVQLGVKEKRRKTKALKDSTRSERKGYLSWLYLPLPSGRLYLPLLHTAASTTTIRSNTDCCVFYKDLFHWPALSTACRCMTWSNCSRFCSWCPRTHLWPPLLPFSHWPEETDRKIYRKKV